MLQGINLQINRFICQQILYLCGQHSHCLFTLNRYFQLVPFPEEGFRDFVLTILAIDLAACYIIDRLMKFLFAPKILFASFEEGMTSKEISSLVRAVGIVGMLMYTFMGNSDQWDELIELEKNLTMNATEMIITGYILTGPTIV